MDIHGHQISLQETPSVTELKSGEEALRKKVELYEEAIRNLTNTKEKIIKEKHTLKEGPKGWWKRWCPDLVPGSIFSQYP